MFARSLIEINNIRAGIHRVGRLSDHIVGVGPFGIGLGGVLAWVPIAGPLYSIGAGLLLLVSGIRARVPLSVLTSAFGLVGIRTVAEAFSDFLPPPLSAAPDIGIDLFRAHKWAADSMVKAIDNTLYVEGRRHPDNPAYHEVKESLRSGAEKRRVVFLG